MWIIRSFRSKENMNKFIEKNQSKIQWHEIFVNNGYAIQYRKLIRVYQKGSKMYFCPYCGEVFSSERALSKHLSSYSHREYTEKLIELFDNLEDFGYFISCLKSDLDNQKTEEWYNS